MGIEKNKVNRTLGFIMILLIISFALVILIQLSTIFLGPSKNACTKKVCLSRFLEGPPAFNDDNLRAYIQKKFFTESKAEPTYGENVGFDKTMEDTLAYILDYFKDKEGGSFVVLGAGDGEYQDLTAHLEKHLNWKGMLIEPHPELFKRMEQKGRKGVLANNCVSPFPYPAIVSFAHPETKEGESEERKLDKFRQTKVKQLFTDDIDLTNLKAQCIPLENLLFAGGFMKKIDLLVLDMSGSDLDVLVNVKMDLLPDLEMVVVKANGASLGSDVGGFFLDKNLVLKKAIGSKESSSVYILTNFIPDEDI